MVKLYGQTDRQKDLNEYGPNHSIQAHKTYFSYLHRSVTVQVEHGLIFSRWLVLAAVGKSRKIRTHPNLRKISVTITQISPNAFVIQVKFISKSIYAFKLGLFQMGLCS